MKVFAVVEIVMNPYGENMGPGPTYGLFFTKDAAKAYIKELQKDYRYENRDKKTGKMPRYITMPKWVVREQEVWHLPKKLSATLNHRVEIALGRLI